MQTGDVCDQSFTWKRAQIRSNVCEHMITNAT